MPLIRHKTVKRYAVGEFKFINGICKMTDEQYEKFKELISQPRFPSRERNQFMEINEQAMATLEKPVQLGVRGPQQSKDIKSQKILEGEKVAGENSGKLDLSDLNAADMNVKSGTAAGGFQGLINKK
jgi:hypothetical protein